MLGWRLSHKNFRWQYTQMQTRLFFKREMRGRMEDWKRKTTKRQARVLWINRLYFLKINLQCFPFVFLTTKLIIFILLYILTVRFVFFWISVTLIVFFRMPYMLGLLFIHYFALGILLSLQGASWDCQKQHLAVCWHSFEYFFLGKRAQWIVGLAGNI